MQCRNPPELNARLLHVATSPFSTLVRLRFLLLRMSCYRSHQESWSPGPCSPSHPSPSTADALSDAQHCCDDVTAELPLRQPNARTSGLLRQGGNHRRSFLRGHRSRAVQHLPARQQVVRLEPRPVVGQLPPRVAGRQGGQGPRQVRRVAEESGAFGQGVEDQRQLRRVLL